MLPACQSFHVVSRASRRFFVPCNFSYFVCMREFIYSLSSPRFLPSFLFSSFFTSERLPPFAMAIGVSLTTGNKRSLINDKTGLLDTLFPLPVHTAWPVLLYTHVDRDKVLLSRRFRESVEKFYSRRYGRLIKRRVTKQSLSSFSRAAGEIFPSYGRHCSVNDFFIFDFRYL